MAGANVRVRVRRGIVQIHVRRAQQGGIVPVAAHKRHGAPYNRIKSQGATSLASFLLFLSPTSAGLAAPFPASGYAAGCSQERQAPKCVDASDAALLKYTYDAPSKVESFQLPPTSA